MRVRSPGGGPSRAPRLPSLCIALLVPLALAACAKAPEAPAAPKAEALAAPAPQPTAAPQAQRAQLVPLNPGGQPVEAAVRGAMATAAGRDVVVYVGAPWCEPCTRFHDAVAAGELDATFPTLTLLELDHDRDLTGLEAAGYASRMIPLFAIPGDDGRSTGRMIQGSVKGEGAVANIVPRLKALLAEGR